MDREVIHELGLQGDWFHGKDGNFSGFAPSKASALCQRLELSSQRLEDVDH